MDNNTNQPAVGKETVEQEDKQKKRLQNVLEYAESLALVFAVMLLIFTFIARPATVDGESMLPTLAQRAPWALERCAEELAQRAQAHNERGDYDSADRCQVQRAAVERVRALLKEET